MTIDKTTDKRGRAVIQDPLLNKGSGFTDAERTALGLHGLVPPGFNTLEQQAAQ